MTDHRAELAVDAPVDEEAESGVAEPLHALAAVAIDQLLRDRGLGDDLRLQEGEQDGGNDASGDFRGSGHGGALAVGTMRRNERRSGRLKVRPISREYKGAVGSWLEAPASRRYKALRSQGS